MRSTLVSLLLASTALAGPDQAKTVDITANLDKLDVWCDDLGTYYVVPLWTGVAIKDLDKWVFVGDAKTMYQQRVIGYGSDQHGYEWTLWSPRVRAQQANALIDSTKQNHLQLECGEKDKRQLTELKRDEALAFLKKAVFRPVLWQRHAELLARDDDGTYFYVDALDEEYGGNGLRVYAGLKGAMKPLPMTNTVKDSAGAVYATKTGSIKVVTKNTDSTAYWIKGGKKVELTLLPVLENKYLIYRELGIYGALGVPCDDV